MATYKNEGYDPQEIQALKDECRQAGRSFVYVEDDDLDVLESGECVHVQFPGQYKTEEVIYDALIYTLRLHHSSMVYEMAVDQVKKTFPEYVPPEDRQPGYRISPEDEEEAEMALTEIIEEIEETETVKVQEHVEIDTEFDYGISLDVCLNTEEITDEVVENFIRSFNSNALSLDNTLYSFTSDAQEE
ncbi:hypothetical protein DYU11_21835 [Fibrisoma montanum]|uniref:Uncharacterized protein n=1 Tax=Fibrisoma montanum TaxID=2305895 RepID=A0A418M4C1_9BACT|nr:hypothetical protein [Fibrisoma montanum]RIV20676.1 hypothetical protein DYU11_21835 [Fibrisoma montanum]